MVYSSAWIVYGSLNLKIAFWGLHTNLQVPPTWQSKINFFFWHRLMYTGTAVCFQRGWPGPAIDFGRSFEFWDKGWKLYLPVGVSPIVSLHTKHFSCVCAAATGFRLFPFFLLFLCLKRHPKMRRKQIMKDQDIVNKDRKVLRPRSLGCCTLLLTTPFLHFISGTTLYLLLWSSAISCTIRRKSLQSFS